MRCLYIPVLAALAMPALAQDFQNFKPAPGTRNYFTVDGAEPTPAWNFVPSIYFNYAMNPLVRRDGNGEITEEIVSDLLSFNALGALGFPYDLELGVDIPLGHASGDDIQTLGDPGFALGDIRLLPKWRLSPADEAAGVSVVVAVVLPTATGGDGQGASSIVAEPKVVADVAFPFLSLAANAGFRYRPGAETVEDLSFGSEFTYGAAVGVPLGTPEWVGLAELLGSAPVIESKGASEPLEGHFGVRWFAPAGPVFTLGAGRGFVAGRGSPDVRVSLGVAWDPRPEPAPTPVPAVAPQDTDGDGLLDPDDQCPRDPEDRDGFEDDDGCPDPDNDQDGLLDGADNCPLEPEDKDGFEDTDGCPDKGEQAKIVVTLQKVEILEKVYFELDRARIKKESYGVLNQVAAVLKSNTQIKLLRIEGHTDRHGSAAYNDRLSGMRARAVLMYLVKRGIDATRLTSQGFGFSTPLRTEETEEADAVNRRVEFVIVEQGKP